MKKKVQKARDLMEDCHFDNVLLEKQDLLANIIKKYEAACSAYDKSHKKFEFNLHWQSVLFNTADKVHLRLVCSIKASKNPHSLSNNVKAGEINGLLQGRFDSRIKDCEHW